MGSEVTRRLFRQDWRSVGQTCATEQSDANQSIMRWGQLGQIGGVLPSQGPRTTQSGSRVQLAWHQQYHCRILTQWGDKGQCSQCNGLKRFGSAPPEKTLAFFIRLRPVHQPKECLSRAAGTIMDRLPLIFTHNDVGFS